MATSKTRTPVPLSPGGALDALLTAIEHLETCQNHHATICEEADDLESRMPDEKEAAINRLIALDGRSPNQADKTVGTDAAYAKLRDRRRDLGRAKLRAEYAVLAAARRVTLAEERCRVVRSAHDQVNVTGPMLIEAGQ